MWGIIPAAGHGTRIQPLAFSKELLPVGSRIDASGIERPRAVGEYLVERMARAGVAKICFVISPSKADILNYFGGAIGGVSLAYVIQDTPCGLCDAIFRALPLIPRDEPVVVGLPDTIWFPADALAGLPDDRFSFLLFPVHQPELFDAVQTDVHGRVTHIRVKSPQAGAGTSWIWGAFKLPGQTLHDLHGFWRSRGRIDEYIGTLVNAWIAQGGQAWGVPTGQHYVDVGTLHGYRQALHLLDGSTPPLAATEPGGPRTPRWQEARPA